jgi:putative transposase
MARAPPVGLAHPSWAAHNTNIRLTPCSYSCTFSSMRTYEFRLYPNRDQHRRLAACLYESRLLYNEMLAYEKQLYAETGTFLSRYDLNKRFAGLRSAYVPATTVQCLSDRLTKALQNFLKYKEDGWGFPRFRSGNQWHSIQLRQFSKGKDVWLDGRVLRVPGKLGTAIKIKRHRAIEGTPKTCYLVKRADGHWYALIVCELPSPGDLSHPADTRPPIGIAVGLKVFLADSDGGMVENPRFFRTSQAALRWKQRRLCARKKGSRRRKMARSTAQTHLKIERQRRDFHVKTAKRYADAYATIVVEDLNLRGLARTRLAKSILDAAWGTFVNVLTYKAASAGGQVVRINPRFTTQKCSKCGELVQKSLSVRTHICPSCGYVADRDVNAAQNILQAGARPSGTLADWLADEPRSRSL